jgi:hypothetical protein
MAVKIFGFEESFVGEFYKRIQMSLRLSFGRYLTARSTHINADFNL